MRAACSRPGPVRPSWIEVTGTHAGLECEYACRRTLNRPARCRPLVAAVPAGWGRPPWQRGTDWGGGWSHRRPNGAGSRGSVRCCTFTPTHTFARARPLISVLQTHGRGRGGGGGGAQLGGWGLPKIGPLRSAPLLLVVDGRAAVGWDRRLSKMGPKRFFPKGDPGPLGVPVDVFLARFGGVFGPF